MSNTPSIGDLVTVWATLGKSDTAMSVNRSYRVTLASGFALPTYQLLDTKIASFHWLLFEPLLAAGTYKLTTVFHVERDNDLIETVQSEIPGLDSPNAATGLPPAVAPLSSFRATLPRPREVSRLYWPFPRKDLLGSDTGLSVSGIAAVQAQANKLLGSLDWGGAGFTLRARSIIRHRSDNSWDTIETADTSLYFASQRRRGRGLQRFFWRR